MVNSHLGVERQGAREQGSEGAESFALAGDAHEEIVRQKQEIICKLAEENFWGVGGGCDLVYGLVSR